MGGCRSGFSAGTGAFAKTTQDSWTRVCVGCVLGRRGWAHTLVGRASYRAGLCSAAAWRGDVESGPLVLLPSSAEKEARVLMSLRVESCPRRCHCGHVPLTCLRLCCLLQMWTLGQKISKRFCHRPEMPSVTLFRVGKGFKNPEHHLLS